MIYNNKVQHFKGQNYSKLKKQHIKGKRLFNDPVFPAINATLGEFNNLPQDIEWKRPGELCETPCLFDDTLSPDSIRSGSFSCGWFVSACTVLAGVGELCYRVIPDYWKQEWSREEEYAGIFHFQLWRYGEWVDVVVDDQLPTSDNTLLFTRCGKTNEFWVPLLEKAYAKLHGSYKALEGGHMCDALVDFTGGVSEIIDLRGGRDDVDVSEHSERSASLFHDLQKEISDHSLVCCIHAVLNEEEVGTRTETGIYRGYAYAVTAAKKISLGETSLRTLFKGREKFSMVRLRDIMDVCDADSLRETEEKRESSFVYSTSHLARLMSTSQEWAKVKESEVNRMGLGVDYKTEFWMPLEDFVKNFTEVTVCHLYNTNLFALSRTWKEASVRGSWPKDTLLGERPGSGSADTHDVFLKNPQYMFDIKNYEEEVVIQMLQWDPTVPYQVSGMPNLLIGFSIIQVEHNRKYRVHKQWEHNPGIVTISYLRKREILYRGHIPRGRYVLVPTTHRPGHQPGAYLVRCFTSTAINLRAVTRDAPRRSCLCCRAGYPIWVTVVNVKGAENLKKIDRLGSCDAYCSVRCEGKRVRTHTVKNSLDPVWNSAFIFYRSHTDKPLTIKVFNHNSCLPDNFVGEALLPATVNHHPTPIRVDLVQRRRDRDGDEPAQGSLHLEIFTSENFMMV